MKPHRILAVVLCVFFFVPIAASPAEAFQVAMLIPAFATWFGGLGAITAGLVQIGIGLATTMLTNMIFKPNDPAGGGGGKLTSQSMTAGDQTPQSFILGKYGTIGNLMAPEYSHSGLDRAPEDGDLRYLTRIIDVSDIPVDSLSHIYVDSNYINLDVASVTGKEIYGRTTSNGQYLNDNFYHIFVKFNDGTQTVADNMLTTVYGSHSKRPWSADMIGKGIAYAVVNLRFDPEVWTSGKPTIKFIVNGIKLYDPRKDGSAGGTGLHRWNNRSTWEWTENPVVMIYNILRGITVSDDVGFAPQVFGGGYDAADLDFSNWSTAMNTCDELVGPTDDTRLRYKAGYEVKIGTPDVGGEDALSVIDELLKTCAAEITDVGGSVYIRVGAPELPTKFITDEDLVVSRPKDLDPFPALNDAANSVHISYRSPSSTWEPREAPIKRDATAEADDGRRIIASVKMPAVTVSKQAQSLAALLLKDNRRFRKHNIPLPPEGLMLRPLQTIDWTSTRYGYSAKDFEVGRWSVDPETLTVTVALRERDANDAIWEGLNEDPVTPITTDYARIGFTLASWAVSAASVPNQAGTGVRPAIKVEWNGAQSMAGVKWQVRLAGATVAFITGNTMDEDLGFALIAEGIVKSTNYEVRGAPIAPGRKIVWTPWTAVSTGNINIPGDEVGGTGADVTPPGQVTGLTAASGVRAIFLNWAARPGSEGVTNYLIYVAEGTVIPASPSYESGGANFFVHMAPTETNGDVDGVTKNYWVAAVDAAGNIGNPSAMVGGSTVASLGVDAKLLQGVIKRGSFAADIDPVVIWSGASLPTAFQGNVLLFNNAVYRWDVSKNPDAYTKETDATSIVGELIAGQIAAGAIGTQQLQSNVIVASKVAITDLENLQPVFALDEPISTLFSASGGTLSWSTDSISGDNALTLTKSAAVGTAATVQTTTPNYASVKAGDFVWIDLAFRNNVAGSIASSVRIQAVFLASDRTTVISTPNVTVNTAMSAVWSTLVGQVEVPSGAKYMTARVVLDAAMAVGTAVRIGSVRVRRGNIAQLVVDGTISGNKLEATNIITLSAQIGDALITQAKIGNLQVGTAKIADAAIVTAKIGDLQVSHLKIKGYAVAFKGVYRWSPDPNHALIYNSSAYRFTDATKTAPVVLMAFGVARVSGYRTRFSGSFTCGGFGSDAAVYILIERQRSDGVWVRTGQIWDASGYRGRAASIPFTIEDADTGASNSQGKLRTIYRLRASKFNGPSEGNFDPVIHDLFVDVEHYKMT